MVKLYFAAYKQHMQCTGGKDVAAHSSRAWQHDASHTLAYEIPLLHCQVLRCAAFSQMQWYRRVKWVVMVAIHAAQRGAVLPCCTRPCMAMPLIHSTAHRPGRRSRGSRSQSTLKQSCLWWCPTGNVRRCAWLAQSFGRW